MTDDQTRRRDEELTQWWDGIVRGDPESAPESLDRETTALVERMHALAHAPTPAGARERARRAVRQGIARNQNGKGMHMNGTAIVAGPFPGTGVPTAPRGRIAPRAVTKPARWVTFYSGSVVLLLVFGLLLYTIYQSTRPAVVPGTHDSPTALPAVVASPEADLERHVWPMFGGSAARDMVAPGPGVTANPTVLWSYPPEGAENRHANLERGAISASAIFLTTDLGSITALDRDAGRELWDAPGYGTFVVLDGDGLIVHSDPLEGENGKSGLARIRQSDGSLVWSAFEGTIASGWSMVIADGVGYIPSGGDFVAFDPATGAELWRVPLNAPASRGASVKDGLAVLGDEKGTVYGISVNGGDVVWTHETGATTIAHPALANGAAYFMAASDTENAFLALDTATGEEKWRFVAPDGTAFRGPAVDETTVYVGTLGHTLYALDAETGAIRWQTELGSNWIQGPLLVDGVLYTSTGEAPASASALDAATGAILWELPVDMSTSGRMVVLDGVVYVGTDLGTIYAIGEGDTASSATPESAPSAATAAAEATPQAEAPPDIQFLWASWGSTTDHLDNPLLIRRSPDGHLWVSDISSRFFIFDLDGNLEEVWGSEGTDPGQFRFSSPNYEIGCIAFAPDGSFYVLDAFNYRIQHFDRDRTYLGEWGSRGTSDGQFTLPAGMVVDVDGSVLVADYLGNTIQRFGPDGTFLGRFDGTGTSDGKLVGPIMPVVDAQGRIYVLETDANRVRIFDRDGNQIGVLGAGGPDYGGFAYPVDLAIDENGYVYVADANNNRIVVFDPVGNFVTAWGENGLGDGQFRNPGSVTVNRGGAVYVADWHGDRIQKFKVSGLASGG